MGDSATVETGGRYVEDPNFEPNPADLRKQFNTSGLGASHRIEETAAVYEVDKAKTAEQVTRALDGDDREVSRDRVILPQGDPTPDEAEKSLLKTAKARVKQKVVMGGPTPAEEAAAEKGDDNPKAKDAEGTDGARAEAGGRGNSPANPARSTGGSTKGSGSGSSSSSSSSSSTAKSKASSNDNKDANKDEKGKGSSGS